MSRRSWLFWAAVALQVLVLAGMIGMRAYTLATGTRIRLQTLPLDPRDPLRGDYVNLRYEISELRSDRLELAPWSYRRDDVIWVVLAPGQPFWRAVAAGPRPQTPGPGQVQVQGRVRYSGDWPDPPAPGRPPPDHPPPPVLRRVGVAYGIESFFVPEGEGRKLERPQVRLEIEVAVDRFGRAAVARAFVDGQELRFE